MYQEWLVDHNIHYYFQHRNWIQTHFEIQKLQMLEDIYHMIIKWWVCSVLQGVEAQ
jgi:hypothetical protein